MPTDLDHYIKLHITNDHPDWESNALSEHQALYPDDTAATTYSNDDIHYHTSDATIVYAKVEHTHSDQKYLEAYDPNIIFTYSEAIADGMVDPEHLPLIEHIQQIEITIASGQSSGTGTIPIEVQTANSFILFGNGIFGGQRQSNSSSTGEDVLTKVVITDGNTVTATRDGTPSFAITLVVTVVELAEDAVNSVQTGSITTGSTVTTNTDTITNVDTARSFVVYQGATSTSTNILDNATFHYLEVTDATTITMTRHNGDGSLTAPYSIVELKAGYIDQLQQFLLYLTSNIDLTVTATITSTDTSLSNIMPAGFRTTNGGVILDKSMGYAEVTNATTLTLTRDAAGNPNIWQAGTAAEWPTKYINSIQRGVVTVASGDTTKDITVTSVDTTTSLAVCLGVASTSSSNLQAHKETFTLEVIDDTTLRVTRGASGIAMDVSWELTEFIH